MLKWLKDTAIASWNWSVHFIKTTAEAIGKIVGDFFKSASKWFTGLFSKSTQTQEIAAPSSPELEKKTEEKSSARSITETLLKNPVPKTETVEYPSDEEVSKEEEQAVKTAESPEVDRTSPSHNYSL